MSKSRVLERACFSEHFALASVLAHPMLRLGEATYATSKRTMM